MGRRGRIFELALGLLLLLAAQSAGAEVVRLGFQRLPSGNELLRSKEPSAAILRSALSKGLTERSGGAQGWALALAERLEVDASHTRWSFKLRDGLTFNNGASLHVRDLKNSIERCRQWGMFESLEKAVPRSEGRNYDEAIRWIDLYLAAGSPETRDAGILPAELALCPVLESSTSEQFGSELGSAGSLVSLGNYVLSDLRPNRHYLLQRSPYLSGDVPGPLSIELSSVAGTRQALAALRSGSLDALFGADLGGAEGESIRSDPALQVGSCYGSNVVFRRGLRMECAPALDLTRLGYPA